MIRRLGLAAALACAASAAQALDANDPPGWYQCRQGNCLNGTGIVHNLYSNVLYQGEWRQGRSVPGTPYALGHTAIPTQPAELVFGEDGLPERGTDLRPLGAQRVIPRFTGTFTRLDHPFMRQRIAVYQEGVYDTGLGIEYRGRFDYIPVKGVEAGRELKGYVIFFGDKVDTEDNTRSSGLFVSDVVYPAQKLLLQPARPDYLTLLQYQYLRDMDIAQDDFRRQDMQKMWMTAFSVLAEIGGGMAGGGGGGGGGLAALGGAGGGKAGFALDLVSSLLTQAADPKADGAAVVGGMAEKLIGRMGGNNPAAAELSKAVVRGIANAKEGQAAK